MWPVLFQGPVDADRNDMALFRLCGIAAPHMLIVHEDKVEIAPSLPKAKVAQCRLEQNGVGRGQDVGQGFAGKVGIVDSENRFDGAACPQDLAALVEFQQDVRVRESETDKSVAFLAQAVGICHGRGLSSFRQERADGSLKVGVFSAVKLNKLSIIA